MTFWEPNDKQWKPNRLTKKQKARFAPILRGCWKRSAEYYSDYLKEFKEDGASDRQMLEFKCSMLCQLVEDDGLSGKDYEILCAAYYHPDTQKWLKQQIR
jgi:hypothetical protein